MSAARQVSCGTRKSGILRVYWGTDCALWQPDNVDDCYWEASHQVFMGDGCVANATQGCACRHLTDFAAPSLPSVQVRRRGPTLIATVARPQRHCGFDRSHAEQVASPSALLGIDPKDLVTKLKARTQMGHTCSPACDLRATGLRPLAFPV